MLKAHTQGLVIYAERTYMLLMNMLKAHTIHLCVTTGLNMLKAHTIHFCVTTGLNMLKAHIRFESHNKSMVTYV